MEVFVRKKQGVVLWDTQTARRGWTVREVQKLLEDLEGVAFLVSCFFWEDGHHAGEGFFSVERRFSGLAGRTGARVNGAEGVLGGEFVGFDQLGRVEELSLHYEYNFRLATDFLHLTAPTIHHNQIFPTFNPIKYKSLSLWIQILLPVKHECSEWMIFESLRVNDPPPTNSKERNL